MKPGDLVELPDGTRGWYQHTDADGNAVVLTYVVAPAKQVKRVKESKS